MPLMTNAEAFRYDFGIYATELWAMTEAQFLKWLNANCDRERPVDMIVRCKDCKFFDHSDFGKGEEYWCKHFVSTDDYTHCHEVIEDDFCSWGKRKEDE